MNMVEARSHEEEDVVKARVEALVQLGRVMGHIGRGEAWPGHASGLSGPEYMELDRHVREAGIANGWATEENVRYAFSAWAQALGAEEVGRWVSAYPDLQRAHGRSMRVGVILAGNVPLVGLHDVLCVWLSGHTAHIKCSSQEPALIPALMNVLGRFEPDTADRVAFMSGKLGDVDAIIATGSDNTLRYFEYYFGHLPRLVRGSRVSVAVLDGSETEAELQALGEDVFRYFGLGCRNVTKLYVPQDFDLDRIFGAFFQWKDIILHNKYANNYEYARALWLLDGVHFLENGFLLLREERSLPSAVATLHYERYADRSAVDAELERRAGEVQCVVGHHAVPFGQAQHPGPGDYADGVDTLRFLLELR